MKKTLALILAAMMVAGTASVAFAANTAVFAGNDTGAKWVYDEDKEYVVLWDGVEPIEQGDSIYLELNTEGVVENDKDLKKEMDKHKVKCDWSYGGDLITSAKVQYVKTGNTASDYKYFVVLTTDKDSTTKTQDLVGKVKVYRGGSSNVPAAQTYDFNFSKYGYGTETWYSDDSSYVVEVEDSRPVKNFKQNDEHEKFDVVTVEFDTVGEFEVNAADQGKLYLGFNKEANQDILNKYDYAELEFVNFPGKPAFYRTGTFSLFVENEDSFVYALRDGKLEAIKATYDADNEAMVFSLRAFPDSLIISDTELEIVNDETSSSEAPAEGEGTTTPSETVKPNPGTGR